MILNQEMESTDLEERLKMVESGKFYFEIGFFRKKEGDLELQINTDTDNSVLKMHKYLSELFNASSNGILKHSDYQQGDIVHTMRKEIGYNKKKLEEKIKHEKMIALESMNKSKSIRNHESYPMSSKERSKEKSQMEPKKFDCPQFRILDDSSGCSEITKGIYSGGFYTRDDLQLYFKDFHFLKFCIIENDKCCGPMFQSDMKINYIPDLIVRVGGTSFSSYFLSYQGRNILLENCQLRPEFPMLYRGLVNNWKSGKRDNLVSFIAYQDPSVVFDPTPYLEVLGNEKWDPEKRERYFPYESIITDYHSFSPDTFDCADGVDIIRKTDGRRATAKINPQHFMFFVWP